MTPLDSVVRVLRGIAAQEAHTEQCASHDHYPYLAMPGGVEYPCDCDCDVRVAARQAEAMLEAAREAIAKATQETANYLPVTDLAMRGRAEDYGASAAQAEFVRVLAQRAEQEKL